jgi:pimeloyl-ACP methyl ester carboxylesterase
MPVAAVNQIEIHYEKTGSGPPLLFLHGLGSSGRDWERQVPHFADTHTVITPDFRGHGSSDKPRGRYSMAQFASDTAQLIRQLVLESVDVVGISLGGMVGFQLAADAPQLVNRLVAVNAIPTFEIKTFSQRLEVWMRFAIIAFLGMEKMGEVLSRRLFVDPDQSEERATLVERWAENDKQAYRNSMKAIVRWQGVAQAMEDFDRPTLFLASEHDYAGVNTKRPYVDAMPAAALEVIEGARHAVPVERPEEFNQVLEEFLAG